jgi:hypothetical protein
MHAVHVHSYRLQCIVTFVEDLQSNACLWEVHCADYKKHSRKVM